MGIRFSSVTTMQASPPCWKRWTWCSAQSGSKAVPTVLRDSPSCAASARVAGSRVPADRRPSRTAAFRARYLVLMGKLSPLDGIGPREIGVQKLIERATDGVVQEVILATNFTAEGEATAHVIGQALKSRGLNVTRLARGVPAGSELEYVDLGTIAHALVDRR